MNNEFRDKKLEQTFQERLEAINSKQSIEAAYLVSREKTELQMRLIFLDGVEEGMSMQLLDRKNREA